MSDTKISALPSVSNTADADMLPVVQTSGATIATRRASLAQLRSGLFVERPFHVRDYGAVGNGVADDGPAIQAAINAMKLVGGGILQFGPRLYRIASPIVINGVTVILQGAGFTEGPSEAHGTWFRIDQTGFTPFTFSGTMARGSIVRDIAIRQFHPNPSATWAPTDYDYVFRVQDCLGAVDFDNVFLVAVNRGIWCDNSGRMNIRRLRGQVYTRGVEVDRCLDICRLEHVHFWTFHTNDANIVTWQQNNQDALVFRKVDGVFLDDIFVLGARSTLRFSSSASGVTTKFYGSNIYADFARYGVWIDGNDVEGRIANMTTQGELITAGASVPLPGAAGIQIDGSNVRVQIGNLRVDDTENNAIRVNGSNNRLDIFAFRAEYYNYLNNGSAAIHLANVVTGTPNQVYLGTPPLLGNGNGGPLINSGTNGFVASAAPAGRVDRPGMMVGAQDTGLFQPAVGAVALSAGGAEQMRVAAGNISLGGAPGAHSLAIATPTATVNQVTVTGSALGGTPSLSATGTDANIPLALSAKNIAPVRLNSRGNIALEVNAVATPVNFVRINGSGAAAPPQITAQGTDTNVNLLLLGKGTGAVQSGSPLQLPSFTVATLPPAATYPRCMIYVADGATNRRFAISDGTSWRWPDGAVVA
ncbi:MAG: glycoside hydrolase family 55 protein [Roseomonas sp.]|nr:glycoside hydrolase family 55 protein [Roseomonas sp.]